MAKRFQTKDLMISIRGEKESELGGRQLCPPLSACDPTIHCPGASIGCDHPTLVPCGNWITFDPCAWSGCGLNYSLCGGARSVWDVTPQITPRVQQPGRATGGGLRNIEDIQALRKELEATLKQLDEVEAEMAGPRTLEEAEDLESKLEDALKELKARKKKLEKRG